MRWNSLLALVAANATIVACAEPIGVADAALLEAGIHRGHYQHGSPGVFVPCGDQAEWSVSFASDAVLRSVTDRIPFPIELHQAVTPVFVIWEGSVSEDSMSRRELRVENVIEVRVPGAADCPDPAAEPPSILVGGIRATLVVDPVEVERTHPFRAHLTLRNTLATRATWTSGMGCIAFLNVYRDGARVPLRGTDFGCLAVITVHTLEPGESRTTSWDLIAQTTDGSALEPGDYVFEADPVLAEGLTLQHPLVFR
jgi:hypothetical protein